MFYDYRFKAGDSWRLPGERLDPETLAPLPIDGSVSAFLFDKDGAPVALTVLVTDAGGGLFEVLADPVVTAPLEPGVYTGHVVFADPGPVIASTAIFSFTVLKVG